MSKKVRWGIIGPGKIARKFAEDLKLSEKGELWAVASRNIDKAKSFAEEFSGKKYYGSYDDLVKDTDVDVIYIATPHSFHFKHTMLCLENNKHVLCEKPMGIDAAQEKIVIAEAKKRNLFLMEGIWTRFIPATEKLLELLEQDYIGEIISLKADFGFRAPVNLEGRIYNKKLGGGALLDIGIYPVYLSILLFGVPEKIKAVARFTSSGVDATDIILFENSNASVSGLEATIESDTPIEATIYGSKGKITLHRRFHHSEKITLSTCESTKTFDLKYNGNGYFHEIEEVHKCLNNSETESDKLPLKTSIEIMETIDRIKNKIGLVYPDN